MSVEIQDERVIRIAVTVAVCVLLIAIGAVTGTSAQTDNECDPGEAPDVIVVDLFEVGRWGEVGARPDPDPRAPKKQRK